MYCVTLGMLSLLCDAQIAENDEGAYMRINAVARCSCYVDLSFRSRYFACAGAWLSQYKGKSHTGQSPFLELDSGEVLCQSVAINVYAANLANRWPSDPLQQARHLELVACWNDVRVHA
jgi:hypothetical protein